MATPFDVITDRVIAMLDKGLVPWRRPWRVDASTGLPVSQPTNAKSGKVYRGLNYLMLSVAGMAYESNLWMTASQAKGFGGKVKAGEQGTAVWYWIVGEKVDETTGKTRKTFSPRYFSVFNLEQTEGVTLPKRFRPTIVPDATAAPVHNVIEAAEEVVKAYLARTGLKLTVKPSSRAFYVPSLDAVTVPELAQYADVNEYYSTLMHELVHSTMHKDRCNRTDEAAHNAFGSEAYSKEELVAEMGAAFLCATLGLDNSTIDNSVAYIAGWVQKFKDDPKVLVQAAGKAQAAADFILNVKASAYTVEEAA